MLGKPLSRLQLAILERPRPFLVGGLLLTLLAVLLGSGVELRSSRSELAAADDPDQLRWDALLQDYQAREAVIGCVEAAPGRAPSGRELERFTDRLAQRIATDPLIDHVFHRLDVEWILSRGLHLLPTRTQLGISEALASEGEFLSELASSRDLAEFNRQIAGRMRRDFGSTAKVSPHAADAVALLETFLKWQGSVLDQEPGEVTPWLEQPVWRTLGEQRLGNGYIKTHDGKTLFLLITPHSSDDSLPTRRALLAALRGHVWDASEGGAEFRVAFTGTPAMTVEEMDSVRRDTWRTSIIAVLGVSLLTLLVFRWKTHALLVLLALAAGVVWSLGAVRLELGYLNLITSAFVPTLVGVGVAYGIHPVSEYELEGAHCADPLAAVRESYRRTGPAVAAAGLTTAAAFFSILLMRFRGFAELGLVAGVGVLLCLLSAMVFLPAILVVYGRRRHARDRQRRDRGVSLDRWWLERVACQVCRFPRATTVLAALVTVWLGWIATGLTFDTNILELLPRNAESVEFQRRMTLDSELSPVFNLVVADDLQELEAMGARAQGEPSIERFESVLRFLPEEPAAARARLAEWEAWLEAVPLPAAPGPLDRSSLVAALRELEDVLAVAGEAAFTAGLGELAGPLERARTEAERCLRLADGADAQAVERWRRTQESLFRAREETRVFLQRSARVEAPSPDNLPPDLRRRFFTGSGKPLGFLYPAESVFEPDELDRYVAASLRVSDSAIGFPFMFHKMSRRITTGFYRAVTAGALLVFLILLIDLRNLRQAVLATLPLAVGLVWALGGMRLLGLSFNFANLVAVPLIVGVGIDNGVHVIHRVRLEGRHGMDVVLRHTGRAILISSLTTMIGFGSLAFASHRGLESLGLLLLLGVGSCLVASIVVLPNLLVVLGIVPSQRPADD